MTKHALFFPIIDFIDRYLCPIKNKPYLFSYLIQFYSSVSLLEFCTIEIIIGGEVLASSASASAAATTPASGSTSG